MQPDFKADYFELFGLAPAFSLDMPALESAWREMQSRVHPDRFAHLGDAEKRASLQWSSRVNEAWNTLRNPLNRATYLLSLHGVDALDPMNTQMAPSFLIQQMTWREALDDARQKRDGAALTRLEQEIRQQTATWMALLAKQLDELQAWQAAASTLRQLKFVEKIREHIDHAWMEQES